MSKVNITITPEKIIYDPAVPSMDKCLHIDKRIYHDSFDVITERKKSYLLYVNGELLGYCQSGSFGMEVIRSLMANKIHKNQEYKVDVNEVDKMFKIYFYQLNEGTIWNSYTLVDKYRLVEVPRIQLKYKEEKTI